MGALHNRSKYRLGYAYLSVPIEYPIPIRDRRRSICEGRRYGVRTTAATVPPSLMLWFLAAVYDHGYRQAVWLPRSPQRRS
jgi:hypothetical protein